jgi:hypothetical protein
MADRAERRRPLLLAVPTPTAPGELRLVRDDLTDAERVRFDRLMATVNPDTTVDVDSVTHLALIARRKPS